MATPHQASDAMVEHDRSYKLLFSHREMVRDLLDGFVRENWLLQLDYASLEKVDPSYIGRRLAARENDVVWRARWGEGGFIYIYLMLEFQSTVDPYMAVRMLTYCGLMYEGLIRTKQLGPDGQLPPMLPIVLYNGSAPWYSARELDPLIQAGPAALEAYRPQMRYLLIDEAQYDEAELASMHNLAAAVFRLENSRTSVQIGNVLGTIMECLRTPEDDPLRHDFIAWIRRTILRKIPELPIDDVYDLTEMQTMAVSLAIEWKAEARREGLLEGRQEGRVAGRQEGRVEGRVEGRREGEVAVLLRLLGVRFGTLPDWVATRLEQATSEQRQSWCEQLLTSESLDALFEGEDP